MARGRAQRCATPAFRRVLGRLRLHRWAFTAHGDPAPVMAAWADDGAAAAPSPPGLAVAFASTVSSSSPSTPPSPLCCYSLSSSSPSLSSPSPSSHSLSFSMPSFPLPSSPPSCPSARSSLGRSSRRARTCCTRRIATPLSHCRRQLRASLGHVCVSFSMLFPLDL